MSGGAGLEAKKAELAVNSIQELSFGLRGSSLRPTSVGPNGVANDVNIWNMPNSRQASLRQPARLAERRENCNLNDYTLLLARKYT